MGARVLLVHSDHEVADRIMAALSADGFEVAPAVDPMLALAILDGKSHVDVLVTSLHFRPGQLHGLALVRMARVKRPGIRTLMLVQPGHEPYLDGESDFLVYAANVEAVVEAVRRSGDQSAQPEQGSPARSSRT